MSDATPSDSPAATPASPSATPAAPRAARAKTRFRVCAVAELPPGERRIVEVAGKSIGVFNVAGNFHALRNMCPHQRAPLCQGTIGGTTRADRPGQVEWEREGCMIRCPWHGWEFDITTGRSVFNPHRLGVHTFTVAVEPDGVEIEEAEDGSAPMRTAPSPAKAGAAVACREIGPGEADPAVETFPVAVEDQAVVLYV